MPLNNLERYFTRRYKDGCKLYDTDEGHGECLEIFKALLRDPRLPQLLRAKS